MKKAAIIIADALAKLAEQYKFEEIVVRINTR